MTPEDLQTIPIPEDLFRYEPPLITVKDPAPSSPVSLTSPSKARGPGVRARGRGRRAVPDAPRPVLVSEAGEPQHIGNGVPCRFLNKRGGCARGAQCAFSHVARTRRTALEEELAKKNFGQSEEPLNFYRYLMGHTEIECMRAELAAARRAAS